MEHVRGKRAAIPNSLNLTLFMLDELRSRLIAEDAPQSGAANRRFPRWPLPGLSVPVRISHPEHGSAVIHAAPFDLSEGGMGVLHSAFVHPGSVCQTLLTDLNGIVVTRTGWVARCVQREPQLFEVGLGFDEPVDVSQFVNVPNAAKLAARHAVVPSDLRGKVVLIEPSAYWTAEIRRELGETQVELVCAADVRQGVHHAGESCDLVILSAEIPEPRPREVLALLRAAGVDCPLIVLSPPGAVHFSPDSPIEQVSIFPRPAPAGSLAKEIARHLLDPRQPNAAARAESEARVRGEFQERLDAIESAIREGDAMRCHGLVMTLKASKPLNGQLRLIALTEAAAKSLAQTMSIEESQESLAKLLAACRKAGGGSDRLVA